MSYGLQTIILLVCFVVFVAGMNLVFGPPTQEEMDACGDDDVYA